MSESWVVRTMPCKVLASDPAIRYGTPRSSSTAVTLTVTWMGSNCIVQIPIDFTRQIFAQQQVCQVPAQFALAGVRVTLTQSGQRQVLGSPVQSSQQFHFAPGWDLTLKPDLQGFHFRMGIGIIRLIFLVYPFLLLFSSQWCRIVLSKCQRYSICLNTSYIILSVWRIYCTGKKPYFS
jgi:hypothetical protein